MNTREQQSSAHEQPSAHVVDRRVFLAGMAALCATGCYKTITSTKPTIFPTRAETIAKPKTLAAAAEATEKAGLATVEWFHPEGVTEPKNPLLYIPYVHRSPDGRIHSREAAVYTQKLLQVVDILATNGVSEFHLEGQKDGVFIPAIALRNTATAPYMTREQLLEMIGKSTFPDDLLRPGEQVLFHMNAVLARRVAFSGAEDPSIPASEYIYNEENSLALERMNRVNVAVQTQKKPLAVNFTYDSAGSLKGVLFGTVEFPADEIEKDTKLLLQFDEDTRKAPRQKTREAYIATHFQNSAVIFGAGHLPSLKPQVLAQGSSLCVISVNGSKEILKSLEEASAFSKELLRQIDIAKSRPKF